MIWFVTMFTGQATAAHCGRDAVQFSVAFFGDEWRETSKTHLLEPDEASLADVAETLKSFNFRVSPYMFDEGLSESLVHLGQNHKLLAVCWVPLSAHSETGHFIVIDRFNEEELNIYSDGRSSVISPTDLFGLPFLIVTEADTELNFRTRPILGGFSSWKLTLLLAISFIVLWCSSNIARFATVFRSKALFAGTALVVVFAYLASTASSRPSVSQRLKFETPIVDLGVIDSGHVHRGDLIILNKSNHVETVEQLMSSCGCLSVKGAGMVVPPNSARRVSFELNETARGKRFYSVACSFSNGQVEECIVEAFAKSSSRLVPGSSAFCRFNVAGGSQETRFEFVIENVSVDCK
ncbi:MAG: hypothetical protein ACF8AM_16680, partial [Rhodopirellula sp. JB055]|uniref:hypothetical protein n=1 Tax=Rhodopirellula sp. JB055 TaxID=3342846 RepID=UPI003709DC91